MSISYAGQQDAKTCAKSSQALLCATTEIKAIVFEKVDLSLTNQVSACAQVRHPITQCEAPYQLLWDGVQTGIVQLVVRP